MHVHVTDLYCGCKIVVDCSGCISFFFSCMPLGVEISGYISPAFWFSSPVYQISCYTWIRTRPAELPW